MKYILIIWFILFLSACSNNTEPVDDHSVLCVFVVDGDTYHFESNYDTIRVRHLYIDCFETSYGTRLDNQAKRAKITVDSALHLGLMARQFMTDLILNKKCELITDPNEDDIDIYGRYLRIVKINNQRVDSILLKNGLALSY